MVYTMGTCRWPRFAATRFSNPSLAGGVEYRDDRHRAFVSLDLTRMNKVLEIDPVSRAARIQAGALGPVLEDQLRPHGYTLRHFPQSFEFSTVYDRTSAFLAVRTIAQAAIFPANCRLLDPGEAGSLGNEAAGKWVLVMGAESAFAPVDYAVQNMIEIARDCGGVVPEAAKKAEPVSTGEGSTNRDAASEAWRSAFLSMPYGRDALARMGGIAETFETATTWDRVDDLYEGVHERLSPAIAEITGQPGHINCRFTHVYPDGAAPYFTVSAAAQPGAELSMWDEIKAASMEILTDFKATVTHHHSVGRDHRPGYDRQVPGLIAESLRAVKSHLDPTGIMNPGVLID